MAFAERFFMGESEVQKALVKVCAALDADGIPYALAGAMALNAYGYRHVTTDLALLLTREGIEAFKLRHLGRGWVERFPGSKGLRDTEHNVKIDVIITGDFPGDGRPKPVAFPDPSVAQRVGEIAVLPVERLVELKLASGLSNPDRMKDLGKDALAMRLAVEKACEKLGEVRRLLASVAYTQEPVANEGASESAPD